MVGRSCRSAQFLLFGKALQKGTKETKSFVCFVAFVQKFEMGKAAALPYREII
jgi:hypothetical protein